MKIDQGTAYKPSRSKNDDIAGYQGDTFWLMDGATQLKTPAHGLDASWHVGQLDQEFRSLLARYPDMALGDLARQGIAETAQKFFTGSGLGPDAPQGLRPFCTLILCRVSGSVLDYLVISDSTLAVIGPDKEEIITDLRIDDDQPLKSFYDLLRTGAGFDLEAARTEMMGAYRHVFERMRNNELFAVGQESSVVDQALTGSLDLNGATHILLMSDGFTRAVDTLDLYPSYAALNEAITQMGIEGVLQQIRAHEADDAKGQRYPRSTIHDDATVLRIIL